MNGILLRDAFAHHVWATLRLIDACSTLSPEQLRARVPGTFGSILESFRHFVVGDAWYLFYLNRDPRFRFDGNEMGLASLRATMADVGAGWERLLAQDLDPDAVVSEVDESDGYQKHAPLSIRLAQALQHGNDHRSQICTALTTLGVDPPAIDAWDYGIQDGRVVEVYPAPGGATTQAPPATAE